jgi:hypothetical protein
MFVIKPVGTGRSPASTTQNRPWVIGVAAPELTPVHAFALVEILREFDVPPDVCQVATGKKPDPEPTIGFFVLMRHFANRRPDMTYLFYDEQKLDLEGFLKALRGYTVWYKETNLKDTP